MEGKKAWYWWWFDSHTTSLGSTWLQSTLSELNEKTTLMLKLIEEDADSFAQRAEMYYKKRPELINMVEDFYRAHRSLAEKYDQLKHHSSLVHPRSKAKYDHVLLNSGNPYDSFTDMSYNSEDSEIHDPEEDYTRCFDQRSIEEKTEGCDELMKIREELDQLREENEFQRNLIELKGKENEEHIMKLTVEIETLKMQNTSLKEELMSKDIEIMVVKRQFNELTEAMQDENKRVKEVLVEKDEEKREVIRQLSSSMEMVREEDRVLRKSIVKIPPKNQRG